MRPGAVRRRRWGSETEVIGLDSRTRTVLTSSEATLPASNRPDQLALETSLIHRVLRST
jgi:hypothetical protein